MRGIKKIAHNAEYSEKSIESYLSQVVTHLGGICLKYSNAAQSGYPDRICLMPEGVTLWFELKSKGEKPRLLQQIRFRSMEALGHTVYVCDSKDMIDQIFNELGYDI